MRKTSVKTSIYGHARLASERERTSNAAEAESLTVDVGIGLETDTNRAQKKVEISVDGSGDALHQTKDQAKSRSSMHLSRTCDQGSCGHCGSAHVDVMCDMGTVDRVKNVSAEQE